MTATLTEDLLARIDAFERKYPAPCTLVGALTWIVERDGSLSITTPTAGCTRLRIEISEGRIHNTEAQWEDAIAATWSNEDYFQRIIAPMVAALHMNLYHHLHPMHECNRETA